MTKFSNFWPNLVKTDNYFYHLLSTEFDVVIDEEDPDVVFHSVDYFKDRNIPKRTIYNYCLEKKNED